MREVFALGALVAEVAADAARQAQTAAAWTDPPDVVGFHGQTVFHDPRGERSGRPLTVQIGEAAVVAHALGAPVVSSFRMADILEGGEGAPLVPRFDYHQFGSDTKDRVLLNLGGIANLTRIPAKAKLGQVVAFDCGPGNMLLDGVVAALRSDGPRHDEGGALAARGRADEGVVREFLADPYFSRRPPKSAGREEFGAAFRDRFLKRTEAGGGALGGGAVRGRGGGGGGGGRAAGGPRRGNAGRPGGGPAGPRRHQTRPNPAAHHGGRSGRGSAGAASGERRLAHGHVGAHWTSHGSAGASPLGLGGVAPRPARQQRGRPPEGRRRAPRGARHGRRAGDHPARKPRADRAGERTRHAPPSAPGPRILRLERAVVPRLVPHLRQRRLGTHAGERGGAGELSARRPPRGDRHPARDRLRGGQGPGHRGALVHPLLPGPARRSRLRSLGNRRGPGLRRGPPPGQPRPTPRSWPAPRNAPPRPRG